MFPRIVFVYMLLAGSHGLWKGNRIAAARAAEQSAGANSDAIAEAAREGRAAMGRKDYAAAVEAYRKLTALAPNVAEFHSNLGIAYYSSGSYREAAEALRRALRLKPALAAARVFLGVALAEGGECREALPYLEKDYTRVSEPGLKRQVGLDGVRCAMATGKTQTAVTLLGDLTRDFPDDPEVLYTASHVFSDLSTRTSERLLEIAPASAEAHQMNAEVLEMQGKSAEAIEEYRKVLEVNPRLPDIHYRIGRLLLAGDRDATALEAARREFDEELKIEPGNAAAEYELGEMARQAREWPQAIARFSRAVKLEPEFAEAQIGLGKSLVAAGRAGEAVAPLEAAVRLEPQNPVAHYQLSFAYRRLGRARDAERELAAYRETHEKAIKHLETIRAGILGRTSRPQSEEPPE